MPFAPFSNPWELYRFQEAVGNSVLSTREIDKYSRTSSYKEKITEDLDIKQSFPVSLKFESEKNE